MPAIVCSVYLPTIGTDSSLGNRKGGVLGPFLAPNGKFYQIITEFATGGAQFYDVNRSTDGGFTWTDLFQSTLPPANPVGAKNSRTGNAVLIGTSIYVLAWGNSHFNSAGGGSAGNQGNAILVFDTVSETWQSPILGPIVTWDENLEPASVYALNAFICATPDGNIHLVTEVGSYTDGSGNAPLQRAGFATYSGGWTALTQFAGISGAIPYSYDVFQTIATPNGDVYTFLAGESFTNLLAAIPPRRLLFSKNFGVPQDTGFVLTLTGSNTSGDVCIGNPAVWGASNEKISLLYLTTGPNDNLAPTFLPQPGVLELRLDGIDGSPSVSSHTVDTTTQVCGWRRPESILNMVVAANKTTIYAFGVTPTAFNTFGNGQIPAYGDVVEWVSTNGTWAGPTIYESYTTPVQPGELGAVPSGVVPRIIGSQLGVMIYVSRVTGVNSAFAVRQYCQETLPSTATLTLIKAVVGGTAIATDFTLTATGAIDTISGAGGVGPSSVTAGDYAITETSVPNYSAGVITLSGSGTLLGNVLTLAPGDVAVITITNTAIPVVPISPGGPRPTFSPPNDYDACLAREYRLYECVDRELLSCAKKPQCFLYDERQWGGNYDDAEEIGQGPPTGSIPFNPTGQVPLPAPIDGDVVIFTTRVPIGYDGIILGQFHGYYSVPIPGPITSVFVEGSGDIRWRVRINSRFGRDCGDILVTLGTLRTMSVVAGGIQVRSGDTISYLVNVPNFSGGLAPGVGSILAGLHGWLYPRK